MRIKLLAPFAIAMLLSSCARDMASTTYTTSSTSGKVLEGIVVSTRKVTLKEHDKLTENKEGGLAGAAVGGVSGAAFGNGTGSVAAAIGGAIVGALAGAAIQDELGADEGVEYLVKLDAKNVRTDVMPRKRTVRGSGKTALSDDMKTSIDTETQTDIVAVVQKNDPSLAEGSKVYVVYTDDRPRLVPKR